MSREKVVGVILVLQGLTLLAQVTGGGTPHAARADLQIPNPGERQLEMIDELKGINAKLEKMLSIVQSGDLAVKVAKPDENK